MVHDRIVVHMEVYFDQWPYLRGPQCKEMVNDIPRIHSRFGDSQNLIFLFSCNNVTNIRNKTEIFNKDSKIQSHSVQDSGFIADPLGLTTFKMIPRLSLCMQKSRLMHMYT